MPEISASETKASASAAISGRRKGRRGAGGGTRWTSAVVLKSGTSYGVRRADAKGALVPPVADAASQAAVDQAAARIAACLTLPSTWLSNCWKFASKRLATSRAALS